MSAAADMTIRRTKDPEQLKKLIEHLYCKLDVSLRHADGDFPVRVLGFANNTLEIDGPPVEGSERILKVENREHLMLLECEFIESREAGRESVRPVALELRKKQARDPRVAVDEEQSRTLWISGCLPQATIPAAMGSLNKKRDVIVRVYANALREALGEEDHIVSIHLRRSNRLDHRMRPMAARRAAIFAPSRYEELFVDDVDLSCVLPFEDYVRIRSYDDYPRTIVSEISYPLWFRKTYLYGYIQILGKRQLGAPAMELAAQTARKLETDLLGYECLPKNPLRCPILDFSHTGIGFLLPNHSPYVKSVMPGEPLILDVHWPDEALSTITGVVKSMKNMERAYRIGLQLDPMTPETTTLIETHVFGNPPPADPA